MTTAETNDIANTVAEPRAHVAPQKTPATKRARKQTDAPKTKKGAKAGAPKGSQRTPAPEGRHQPAQQQEGGGDRDDETRQGCDVSGDHGDDVSRPLIRFGTRASTPII
jgi:hypothetical protein